MRKRGIFITFEGTDGVGKSTHIRLAAVWLRALGHRVVLTREPGGGRLSEILRRHLLNPKNQLGDRTELLLYEAARAEHVRQIIAPALKRGAVVLCDRFTDATTAYQGFGRRLPLDDVTTLNRIATGGLTPQRTILLLRPTVEGLRIARARKHGAGDRLEQEGLAFQNRVRRGYEWLARRERRILRIPVRAKIEDTQMLIRAGLEPLLKSKTTVTRRGVPKSRLRKLHRKQRRSP